MLDQFDQEVLSASGKAKDLIREFYGAKISQNNAQKQMAGIRRHIRFKKKMEDPTPSDMEEIQIKGDGTRTTTRMIWLSEEDKKSPSRIMELMGFDSLQWELKYCDMKRSHWNSITKNGEGEGEKHTLHAYNCKVSVKPIQDIITLDMLREVFDDFEPPKLKEIKYSNSGGYLLEIPIVDFHLGLLSWEKETGENYDLEIAEELYRNTILEIIAKVESYNLKIEQIIFPIGQDFFNSDTTQNTTTKGTALDSDSRWGRMFKSGVELLIWAIEELRQIAPVKVFHIPGNHDEILSYCAVVAVDAYFRNLKRVEVNTSPAPRKYEQYGLCGIGYAHGDEEGKRIEKLFQVEAPELWGKTKYREFHLGHLHHESAKEDGGIIIRHIGTMKVRDAYETKKGYIGAIHKVQAFVWDKEKGKVLTIDVLSDLTS
jgi:hypothetical protein